MNESFEENKSVDKYIEGAMRNNADFLDALSDAASIEQIQNVIREFTFVDEEGEGIVFEIISKEGEDDDANTFSEEALLNAVALMKDGVPEEHEIHSWIPHKAIAAAVMRVSQTKN